MIRMILGGLFSALGTLIYFDFRKTGRRGFARFVAFWLGFPWTLLVLIMVPNGRDRHLLQSDADDDRFVSSLQDEILADRIRRRPERVPRIGEGSDL